MNRSSMPPRRKPLRRVKIERSSGLRRTGMRRTPRKPNLPVDARAVVRVRSGGDCEPRIPWVCTGRAEQVHHRIAKGMGGSHGEAREVADRPASLAEVCAPCHRYIHAHPVESEMRGLLLKRGSDATAEWVWFGGRSVYLDDFGGVHGFEEGVA